MADEMQDNAKTGVGFVLGLLVGSLIGAATAILVAPQSGTQTREFLKRKAFEAKDKASHVAEDLKDDIGEWTTKAKDKVAEKVTEARGKVNEKVSLVNEKVAQVLHRADKDLNKPVEPTVN